eukprot:gene10626-11777_t
MGQSSSVLSQEHSQEQDQQMKAGREVRDSSKTDVSSNSSLQDIDEAFYSTFIPEKLLGYGSSGNVLKAHHCESRDTFACKSVVASVETESGEVRGEVSSVVSLVDKIPNRLKRDERLVRQTSKITKEDVGKFDTVPHVMSQKENEEVMDSHAKPLLAAQVGEGEETVIKSLEGAAKAREHIENDDEEEGKGKIRTATGGIVHSAIVLLTLFAFAGNAAFLVYVFWLSK